MGLDYISIAGGIFVGIGAALTMDLWNVFLRRAFGISSLNFCLVGRWVSSMLTGTFTHANISAAPKRTGECALGWTGHFLISVAFALLLILPTSGSWLQHPTFLPALFVGAGTVVIPYFVVQPALGLGIASANTPNPTQARLKSLMTHTAFGVGLYISGMIWNLFVQAAL